MKFWFQVNAQDYQFENRLTSGPVNQLQGAPATLNVYASSEKSLAQLSEIGQFRTAVEGNWQKE